MKFQWKMGAVLAAGMTLFSGGYLQAVAAPQHHAFRRSHHVSRASTTPTTDVAPMTQSAQLALLKSKCDPSISSAALWRASVKGSEILAQHNIMQSPLSVLYYVNRSIPHGVNVGMHPQDIFAAYITLRMDGQQP